MNNKQHPIALVVCALMTWSHGCSSPDPGGDAGPDGPIDAGARDAQSTDAASPDGETPPEAGPVLECEVGETRTAACGFCGTEAQRCDEPGRWSPTSACLGQRECAVGTVDTLDGELCAQDQRICLDGCIWSEWERVREAGVCERGATRRVRHDSCLPTERIEEQCTDSCEWEARLGTCFDTCTAATPRTTPEWAREVCIPAGPFVRGTDDSDFHLWSPSAVIEVSAFMIDVYPVTNRRYQQCVAAGACAAADGTMARTSPEYLDYPVQGISRNDAEAFCAWDGGRRFLTAAEWQKAARGPAPRMQRYPWGNDIDCSIVNSGAEPCWAPMEFDGYAKDPYDAFPASAASYYGVQMMGFGVREWVIDSVCAGWNTLPESMEPDPVCLPSHPAVLPEYLRLVSGSRLAPSFVYDNVGFAMVSDDDSGPGGVRCGRSL